MSLVATDSKVMGYRVARLRTWGNVDDNYIWALAYKHNIAPKPKLGEKYSRLKTITKIGS